MPGQGEPGHLAERPGVCHVSGREALADGGVEKEEAGMKVRRMQGAEDCHGRRQAGGTGHRRQGGAGHGLGALWGRAGGIRGGDHPVEAGGD